MIFLKSNYFCVSLLVILIVVTGKADAEDCLKKKGEECVTCCLNKYVNVSPRPGLSPYYPASSGNQPDEVQAASKKDDPSSGANASFTEYDDCRKQCK